MRIETKTTYTNPVIPMQISGEIYVINPIAITKNETKATPKEIRIGLGGPSRVLNENISFSILPHY